MGAVGAAAPTIFSQWVQIIYSAPTIRRGSRGGCWGARPPLGRSFAIQYALFNNIQAPVHHWAPTPERKSVSAPDNIDKNTFFIMELPKTSFL